MHSFELIYLLNQGLALPPDFNLFRSSTTYFILVPDLIRFSFISKEDFENHEPSNKKGGTFDPSLLKVLNSALLVVCCAFLNVMQVGNKVLA